MTVFARSHTVRQAGQAESFSLAFKEAMSRFPSGVTVVTAIDETGLAWGFTASSFCSVSMSPPLVLVCLATSADCYHVFKAAKRWAVNILNEDQCEPAQRFATKGVDKFAGDQFDTETEGLPVLREAVAVLQCRVRHAYPGGDHIILVGEVTSLRLHDRVPLVHYARHFPRLAP